MPYIWPNPSRPAGSCVTGSTTVEPAPHLTVCRGRPHRSSPIVRRAPVRIWRSGGRARASGAGHVPPRRSSASRSGAMATGNANEGQHRPRAGSCRATPMESATPKQGEAVEQPGPAPPEAYGECLLARLGVRCDVAQVVGLQESGGQQTDGHPGPEHEPPVEVVDEEVSGQRDDERRVLDVGRARRGHETEEDEDEQLAEAEVAVGPRSAGVGPPRDAAHETERDEPPRDAGRQPEARQPGHAEGDERGDLHLAAPWPACRPRAGPGRPGVSSVPRTPSA